MPQQPIIKQLEVKLPDKSLLAAMNPTASRAATLNSAVAHPPEKQPCSPPSASRTSSLLISVGCVAAWILLSNSVIMFNKWIMSEAFAYPVTLSMWDMLVCGTLARVLTQLGVTTRVSIPADLYLTAIVPIGALHMGSLWLGNAAYLYLSVSFIQMLKALSPVAVFTIGCMMGKEKYSHAMISIMFVISFGVAVASYGEIDFVPSGVIFQLSSILTESLRVLMVQVILQDGNGVRLNPISMLYYVAPVSFCFLSIPWAFKEAPALLKDATLQWSPFLLLIILTQGLAAFILNTFGFLVLARTSALTMNIAGIIKAWLLIASSPLLMGSKVTALNIEGYAIAFVGVTCYHYLKMKDLGQEQEQHHNAINYQPISSNSHSESSSPMLKHCEASSDEELGN